MDTPINVPSLGESITRATLVKWYKKNGDPVRVDEPLCELETDKANVDISSNGGGFIQILSAEGDTVEIGQTIAKVLESSSAITPVTPSKPAPEKPKAPVEKPAPSPVEIAKPVAPTAPKIEKSLPLPQVGTAATVPSTEMPEPIKTMPPAAFAVVKTAGDRREPMTKLRKRIAERLVQAQHTAAILTTFNEIDLSAVSELRSKHKENFEKVHGVSLGFMSFFARATSLVLREIPKLNASIDGNDLVYHGSVNLGIAVSTDRGLAVPVLRNVGELAFFKIETEIQRLAGAARDGKLQVEELSGSTFTITNGGVFGSMLSTPILNPPDAGILGMHAIQKRAVVINDKIEIRPMMYVALSYDHRIVDGKEAITFLVRLKHYLEDPARMMLEI